MRNNVVVVLLALLAGGCASGFEGSMPPSGQPVTPAATEADAWAPPPMHSGTEGPALHELAWKVFGGITGGTIIPNEGSAGVSDTITIRSTFEVRSATVSVLIDHPEPSELRLQLRREDQTEWIPVYQGGTFEIPPVREGWNKWYRFELDLGPQFGAQGEWRLEVRDQVAGHEGKILEWSLLLEASESRPPFGGWR